MPILLTLIFLIEIVLLDWLLRKYSTMLFWLAVLLSWYFTARTLCPN